MQLSVDFVVTRSLAFLLDFYFNFFSSFIFVFFFSYKSFVNVIGAAVGVVVFIYFQHTVFLRCGSNHCRCCREHHHQQTVLNAKKVRVDRRHSHIHNSKLLTSVVS